MTKLGVHVASPNRNGIGKLLDAGAALVVLVDQNMIDEAKQHGAVVAFRAKRAAGDNPQGIIDEHLSNIPRVAFDWMKKILPVWRKNPGADYYLINNELDIGTLESGAIINAFALECMKLADSLGYHVGILNCAPGNPSDDRVNGQTCTMEQRLETILPAIEYATQHDHAISLHIHALDYKDLKISGEHIALRHQRFLRYCAAHGLKPKVLITELSNGVGGVEPNDVAYIAALRWWDQAVQASHWSDQIIGAACYGFNAAETLAPIVPQLAALMRETVTPPPPDVDRVIAYRGTCLQSKWADIAAGVVAAGGTIERVTQ